jgi:hypothetical protein
MVSWLSVRVSGLSENLLKVLTRPLTREALSMLRVRARRRGVWFRFLSRVERGLMDLAIRVVETVRSRVLARALCDVVVKLRSAMEGEVARLMRTVGRPLAQKLSAIAKSWGNDSAGLWFTEFGFVWYLAMMQRNLPRCARDMKGQRFR